MLPFLKREKEASVSMPSDSIKREPDEGHEEYDSMHAAAEDLLHAIQSKNVKALAECLRAAFELMESEPHEEGEHI